MKRVWETDELVEYWTLMPPEVEFLANKIGATKLGCAVLLKFFQLEARFPQHAAEIPPSAIDYLAKQVKVAPEQFQKYAWRGRTIEYHRAQIRQLHGFREATVEDANALSQWLQEHILVKERDYEHLKAAAYQKCRELKIEPPTPERVDRIVRSAARAFEEKFCAEILSQLTPENQTLLDSLLQTSPEESEHQSNPGDEKAILQRSVWQSLKADSGRASTETMCLEIAKLEQLRNLNLPAELFANVPRKILLGLRRRAAVEEPYELRRHPSPLRYTLLAAFCCLRIQEISDTLVDVLLEIVHRIGVRAERKVEKEILEDFKKVTGKANLLFRVAEATLEKPDGIVKEVVYPVVPEPTLRDLVKEWKANGPAYRRKVSVLMRNSYRSHYRRIIPKLLETLEFRSNNDRHRPVILALKLLKEYAGSKVSLYPLEEDVPFDGMVKKIWLDSVLETDRAGNIRVNRINYELCVLQTQRERLRCKEIWVVGADRYRNPDDDLPADFEAQRDNYYEALHLPLDADSFIDKLQQEMREALALLNKGLPKNPHVQILSKNKGWIALSPLEAQPEPLSLLMLKAEMSRHWQMNSLLDILKETDFRVGFTETFKSPTAWESLERTELQPRLLLSFYGLGTNTGLKRMSAGEYGFTYKDLLYVRRRFINKDHLRNAIRQVVNAIFQVRQPNIWGEGTTACASDSKKFGAYDQNLMTEWHARYGGRGVMIYWHVERKSTCIYSQLKTCSSSEAASMIEGVLRHCTEMSVNKQYVDSHGQSEVAFAFCRLLRFELLPRLKAIHRQKLYRVENGKDNEYRNLQPILKRAIDWKLIRQQYDLMVKYATALRLGTAETEAILRRFTRQNLQHPTYKALSELGKAIKTIFLCRYLHSIELRREIHEGLNVIENWNSVNGFIMYGKGGEFASNRREDQEITMLSLHLLQISLVYINTLMIQQILSEPEWQERLQPEDYHALTPLIYSHVTPYGTFKLDMNKRLVIEKVARV
ncbi:Tn3 family transposase [Planktothrix sp. FACHB-1355]|uniref:Tn3 family transposase n=1 Tax=Planktothrix sp. FACHB-1355 TaxID=2692854 RepID=UPI00168A9291|nr:Tn3 family transposase [Planktothrix sp. FACHB-1355]MBD3557519.1 Tn3 family transposase [Planktothrix sp. FACHB-1355]MBD3885877.1 Tn3 family transposase [Phormidium tenue FACHB-886]